RTFLVTRGRISRLDLIGLVSMLDAERHVERRSQPDLEIPIEVEIGGPLARDEIARVKLSWRRSRVLEKRDVRGVDGIHPHVIAPVGAGKIPAPVAEYLPLQSERGAEVVFLGFFLRVEAEGIDLRDPVRCSIVLVSLRVLAAIRAEAIERRAFSEREAGVVREDRHVVFGVA